MHEDGVVATIQTTAPTASRFRHQTGIICHSSQRCPRSSHGESRGICMAQGVARANA
jgi:hypothetical protein